MNTNTNTQLAIGLTESSLPFLDFLQDWMNDLPVLPLSRAFPDASRAAIISVDITQGFCKSGALASPRVGALVTPIVALFRAAWARGVRHILLSQDTHDPAAEEFAAFPAHCVRGTAEAETVDEIKRLPFYSHMQVFEKNSLSSTANTGLNAWIAAHPEVTTYVVVGDCTDLCVYQLAMELRTTANASQIERRVIVPAGAVDTYDLPVETARAAGILPHPADLMHATFLYHMALNGVEVVQKIVV